MAEFVAMGGYAAYVWPSYALTAAVLIGLLWSSLRALRAREADLAREDGRGESRRRDRSAS
ncbi:MAG: heme exporter protein CcmD [Rhodospirillales bacterium]|nr:heme exporter protein CcmD [Rhodospirillales bacterium]